MQNLLHQQRNFVVSPKLIWFCTIAIFLFSLTKFWIGTKFSAYFEAAFLLPFYYIVFKNWWYFKKSKLTWLCIAMLAVPVLQFLVQYYQNPELAMKYQGVDKLFRLTFFLAAAFWLSYNLNLIPWFILMNLIGFIILLLIQPDLSHYIREIQNGWRAAPKEVNPAFLAMYAGIFWLLTPVLIYYSSTIKNAVIRRASLFALSVIWIALSIIIYSAQTRATLLALILSTFLISITFLLDRNKSISFKTILKNKYTIPSLLIITTVLGLGINKTYPKIENEISKLTPYLSGESDKPAQTSFGWRIELWNIAIDKTRELPLIGMGGESRFDAILNTPNISHGLKHKYHHFHNSFFEFSVAYGILGLTLLCLFLYKVTYVKEAQRVMSINKAAQIYTAASIFILTVNLFESYLFFWQGSYTLVIALTPILAIRYHSRRQ